MTDVLLICTKPCLAGVFRVYCLRMKLLKHALKLSPVVYVTRDLERATGLSRAYQSYYIITNHGPFAKEYAKKNKNVLVIKSKEKLDTRELLVHPKTIAFVNTLQNPKIIVFKNTKQIETICSEKKWPLLNPPAELASRVEEKISQLEWLGDLQKYVPPHQVMLCKNLTLPITCHTKPAHGDGAWTKYIVQFNRAHTGSGTMLIESEKQINELKEKFPNREVRVTKCIKGPALTSNNVVWGKKVLIGNNSYQITGLPPFTENEFATIGNDWALPTQLLGNKQIRQIRQIVTAIGKKLIKDGWKGLFGIDIILDEKTGKIFLIEINARQPASTTFESALQRAVILSRAKNLSPKSLRSFVSTQDDKIATTFEAHLAALLGLETRNYELGTVTDGAQIIKRMNNEQLTMNKPKTKIIVNALKNLTLNVIEYNNIEPGADWLRIQNKKGIMAGHNTFNERGIKIKNILKK